MSNFKLIIAKQTVKREPPLNLKLKDSYLFLKDFSREMPDLIKYNYKNVNINSNEYLWRKFRFLEDTFFRRESRRNSKISNLKFLIKAIFKKKRVIKKGLWLIDNWSYGYFHWFGDVLQKYTALNSPNAKLILPGSYLSNEYIISSSKLLNIELEFIKNDEIIKCNHLTIVRTTFISGNYYPLLITNLRTTLQKIELKKREIKSYKIIYISRKKSSRRKVYNEEAMIKTIQLYNGDVFYFEDYNLVDQINLVKNCEILICPHGASIMNILFAKAKIKIIELRHENSNTQNMYFSMASALNLDYYYLKCKGISIDPHSSDIVVPINELNELLKQIE